MGCECELVRHPGHASPCSLRRTKIPERMEVALVDFIPRYRSVRHLNVVECEQQKETDVLLLLLRP